MKTRPIRSPGPSGMNMSQRALNSPTLVAVLMVIYTVLFATIVVVFWQRLNRAADPAVYREAREYGLPATAKVLRIERTRWRVRRSCNFSLRFRPQRFEYQMRLLVTRAGAADYDADMAEYLSGANVPERGNVIAVKVHPEHPEVVVLSHKTHILGLYGFLLTLNFTPVEMVSMITNECTLL